jgi:ABC-type antimicrobial peptide transport system permease subunit
MSNHHNLLDGFMEVKVGLLATLIISWFKMQIFEDVMHGVWTAIGGLMVTIIYSIAKRQYVRYKRKKMRNKIEK